VAPFKEPDPDEVQVLEHRLQEVLDKIPGAVDHVRDSFNDLVARATLASAVLGDTAAALIADGLHEIREELKKFLDLAVKVNHDGFPVVSLFRECFGWLIDVMGPTSDIAAQATVPADDNLSHWSGGASGAYRQKMGAQKAALDKTVENSKMISSWLFDVGRSNVDYAAGLLARLTDLALELTKIIQTMMKAKNPDYFDLIATLVRAFMTELEQIAIRTAEAIGKLREVAAEILDHRVYEPGDDSERFGEWFGNWPQAAYLDARTRPGAHLHGI
jgi:hypothetical protein